MNDQDPSAQLRAHITKYRSNNKLAFQQLFFAFTQWIAGFALYHYNIIPILVFFLIESLSLLHMFMIYHDMGHNSFFESASANAWGEFFMQFFIITPVDWSKKHKIHHGTSGDLSKGPSEWNDTIYFTSDQYFALSTPLRIGYRIIRDPFFFFTCIPILNWFVKYRIPFLEMLDRAQHASKLGVIKNSIVNTTGSVAVFYSIWTIFGSHVAIAYLLPIYMCTSIGVALFHLQHAFNPSYTVRDEWNLRDSAIKGSSILTIPAWIKPWTMGIEYHHIHHYSSIVPGYLLRKCHEEAPPDLWLGTTVLTYQDMFNSLFLTLYDESTGKYVSFAEAEGLRKQGVKPE